MKGSFRFSKATDLKMLEVGIKGTETLTVTEKESAKSVGSGLLPVFATPSMIALCELCASNSVQNELSEGTCTVGTLINIKHLAATPLGMKVRCESELIEIDRKRLVFTLSVFDEREKIGEGTHERFIVTNEKFMAKANVKICEN